MASGDHDICDDYDICDDNDICDDYDHVGVDVFDERLLKVEIH